MFFYVSPELTKKSHKFIYCFRWVWSWCLMEGRDLSGGVSNVFMGLGNRQAASQWRPRRISAVHVWRMFSTRRAACLATAVQTAGPGRRWGGEGRGEKEEGGLGEAARRAVSLAEVRQAEAVRSVGTVPESMCKMLWNWISSYSQTARGRGLCVCMCQCVCVPLWMVMCANSGGYWERERERALRLLNRAVYICNTCVVIMWCQRKAILTAKNNPVRLFGLWFGVCL